MSTNYYLKDAPCPTCGRGSYEGLHIGKSSAGWAFSLRVYPEGYETGRIGHSINDLDDWIPLFKTFGIIDEYGKDVSSKQMIGEITERSFPNGLRRHAPEAHRCLGPGAGTWDLLIGEFS